MMVRLYAETLPSPDRIVVGHGPSFPTSRPPRLVLAYHVVSVLFPRDIPHLHRHCLLVFTTSAHRTRNTLMSHSPITCNYPHSHYHNEGSPVPVNMETVKSKRITVRRLGVARRDTRLFIPGSRTGEKPVCAASPVPHATHTPSVRRKDSIMDKSLPRACLLVTAHSKRCATARRLAVISSSATPTTLVEYFTVQTLINDSL
ncbi:hypothetical protein BC826DRAFT_97125 [Russula brevipes]|nr:hypothetical protein BC826DRAFT_97125 [Russula brevipes]